MVTHSSILAWRIPRTEEPGGSTIHGVTKSQTRLEQLTLPFNQRAHCHFCLCSIGQNKSYNQAQHQWDGGYIFLCILVRGTAKGMDVLQILVQRGNAELGALIPTSRGGTCEDAVYRGHVWFHERWKVKVNTTYRNLVLKSFLMELSGGLCFGSQCFL